MNGIAGDGARVLPELEPAPGAAPPLFGGPASLAELLLDVEVPLGSVTVSVGDLVALRRGTLLRLERLTGEPLEILVNGTPIARGEVRVHGERFAIRITEILKTTRADANEEVPLAKNPAR